MNPRPLADINITPLIDVLLVLLIIFMLVTPVASHVVDVALPQPSGAGDLPPATPVILQIDVDGYRVNRGLVASREDLARVLSDIYATRSDRTLFVQAAPGNSYGRVVDALGLARGAGALRLGLLGDRGPS